MGAKGRLGILLILLAFTKAAAAQEVPPTEQALSAPPPEEVTPAPLPSWAPGPPLAPARGPDHRAARQERLRRGLFAGGGVLIAAGVGVLIGGGFYWQSTDDAVQARRARQKADEEACRRAMRWLCGLNFDFAPGLDYAGPVMVSTVGMIPLVSGLVLVGLGAREDRGPPAPASPGRAAARRPPVELGWSPYVTLDGGGLRAVGRF